MVEITTFPDVVALVIGYLDTELANRGVTAHVGTVVPSPLRGQVLTVHRTGGLMITNTVPLIDQAQLTFDSYAEHPEDAHDLLSLCRSLIHAMRSTVVNGTQVCNVDEFSGPQDMPDPVTEKPRFTMTMQVCVRGAPG